MRTERLLPNGGCIPRAVQTQVELAYEVALPIHLVFFRELNIDVSGALGMNICAGNIVEQLCFLMVH